MNSNEILQHIVKTLIVSLPRGIYKEYQDREHTTDVQKIVNIATNAGLTFLAGIVGDHFDKNANRPTYYIPLINRPAGVFTARHLASHFAENARFHKSHSLYLIRRSISKDGYYVKAYAYVLVPYDKIKDFEKALKEPMLYPAEHGSILAYGEGEPPTELAERMIRNRDKLEN